MPEGEIQFPHYAPPQRGVPVADRAQSRVLFKAIKHLFNQSRRGHSKRKSLHRDDNVHIKRRKPIFY